MKIRGRLSLGSFFHLLECIQLDSPALALLRSHDSPWAHNHAIPDSCPGSDIPPNRSTPGSSCHHSTPDSTLEHSGSAASAPLSKALVAFINAKIAEGLSPRIIDSYTDEVGMWIERMDGADASPRNDLGLSLQPSFSESPRSPGYGSPVCADTQASTLVPITPPIASDWLPERWPHLLQTLLETAGCPQKRAAARTSGACLWVGIHPGLRRPAPPRSRRT